MPDKDKDKDGIVPCSGDFAEITLAFQKLLDSGSGLRVQELPRGVTIDLVTMRGTAYTIVVLNPEAKLVQIVGSSGLLMSATSMVLVGSAFGDSSMVALGIIGIAYRLELQDLLSGETIRISPLRAATVREVRSLVSQATEN